MTTHSRQIERPKSHGYKRRSQAEIDAQAVRAFEMRAVGASTYEIAAKLGVTVDTAIRWIERARDKIVPAKVEAARELSMRSLELAQRKLLEDWDRLKSSADQANGPGRGKIEHSAKFADSFVRLQERMAKLQGLDRPQLIEATITLEEGGIDAELKRLTETLGLAETEVPEMEQEPVT